MSCQLFFLIFWFETVVAKKFEMAPLEEKGMKEEETWESKTPSRLRPQSSSHRACIFPGFFLNFFSFFLGVFRFFWFGFSEAAARRWSKTYRRRATLKKTQRIKK